MMDKQCTDCRDAEHGNSSPKVDLVIVRDPDGVTHIFQQSLTGLAEKGLDVYRPSRNVS